MVEQHGLWYHVNMIMICNRSDVIEHGLPLVCSLYYTLSRQLGTAKILYMLPLGNPKAAAHVAVRPSVLVTVKH